MKTEPKMVPAQLVHPPWGQLLMYLSLGLLLAVLAQHRGCLDVLPWHRNALAQGHHGCPIEAELLRPQICYQ